MTVRMTPDGLPAACCARWTPSGCSWPSTGVEPTNNRAERALRFGVLWRKRSQGTASEKGNRWVERILSLKETCRLQAQSTYTVLVDAVTKLFRGQPPDLAWLRQQ